MFTICSLYVHYIFTIYSRSQNVHYIFTIYSPYLLESHSPGGKLVDFYYGRDHVHIWGLKCRKDEHI